MIGEKKPYDDPSITHSICDVCYRYEMEEMMGMKKEKRIQKNVMKRMR
jgi:hypothetical protein